MPYREQIRKNEKMLFSLAKLIFLLMIIQLGVIFYIGLSSYQGRQDLVKTQRAGCSRGKLDRAANAQGWRIAEEARRADGQLVVAKAYSDIAEELEERSRIDCIDAFPKARIIP